MTTERARHILRHALGLGSAPLPYRNYFVAGPADEPDCHELAAMGYMNAGQADRVGRTFTVTAVGEAWLALYDLRIDANRLCDRQLGGTYEEDCRRSIAQADEALRRIFTLPQTVPVDLTLRDERNAARAIARKYVTAAITQLGATVDATPVSDEERQFEADAALGRMVLLKYADFKRIADTGHHMPMSILGEWIRAEIAAQKKVVDKG